MALRKPLVLVSGEIAQLPAGDDIDAPFSGAIEFSSVNDNAGAVVIGTPVYASAAGHFDKANATVAGTSKVIGLTTTTSVATSGVAQIACAGTMSATTAQWDAVVTGGSGGLVFNTNYYLDTTAGKITTAPTTTVGQNNVFIGRGLSTTVMELGIRQPIPL